MATFTELEISAIVDILDLSIDELETGSALRKAAEYLEQQDVRLSLDNVTKVKNAIIAYQTAQNAYNTAIENDTTLGVKLQSVYLEYEVEWATKGAGAAKYNNYIIAMRRYRDLIRRYLRWKSTNYYSGSTVKAIS